MSDQVPPNYTLKHALAVDFDGVIHRYSKGWHTKDIYDPPMRGAFEALAELLQRWNIVIMTARPAAEVAAWCKLQAPRLRFVEMPITESWWNTPGIIGVTNRKVVATAYIDDRAVRFTNWQDILNYFR